MPRLRHDEPGMVYACPACDTAPVYLRTGNGNTSNHSERPFRCEGCGVATYYVVEREAYLDRDLGAERWAAHREAILAEHGLLTADEVRA